MDERTEQILKTMRHIRTIQGYMTLIGTEWVERTRRHDESKLDDIELYGYVGIAEATKGLTAGSQEYLDALEPYKTVIRRHYILNDHHPEHFANRVNGMNLIQVLEMVCDWIAASTDREMHPMQSIDTQCTRFNIDAQLKQIIINTMDKLGFGDYGKD